MIKRTNATTTVIVGLLLLQTSARGQGPAPADQFDIIIRNGDVIDGTGAAPFRADVAIAASRIVRIGNLARHHAGLEIDARGHYVAPGFINLHSHASAAALPTAENMLTQGVTTEILNPDGGGRTDLSQQLAQASAEGLAVNIGAYIGFNSAWSSIVGDADRRATPEEIARMRDIVTSNLEHGAWGVSAGLDYKPAYYSTTEEVVEVVKAAAPYRTNFTNHDRLTPEAKYSSRAGIAETIGIGARAGLVPVITHMKVQGREQGSAATTLGLMRDATARGNYTAADAYPYLAGQTGLGALLIPGWAQEGGREKMLERFKDPALRARIIAEAEEAMTARFGGPQGVFLPTTRRELVDVMKEMNVSAGEAVLRLLETDNQGAILRFGVEEDLIKILQHPTTSIACDCGASLPGRGGHPRNQGTYPRVLGHYVRERKAFTWQEAVRKMTLLPAVTIGMIDRGAIAVGMAADVTIFDPAIVIDRATYQDPTLRSEGIRHVIVNGMVALRDGVPTGERGGRVLRRGKYMPSRPMPATDARGVAARGTVTSEGESEALTMRIDVAQARAARSAKGLLRMANSKGKTVAEARDFGFVQTANGWASFTALLRMSPSGEDRAATIVIDRADPSLPDRSPSLTVVINELFEARGPAAPGSVRIR